MCLGGREGDGNTICGREQAELTLVPSSQNYFPSPTVSPTGDMPDRRRRGEHTHRHSPPPFIWTPTNSIPSLPIVIIPNISLFDIHCQCDIFGCGCTEHAWPCNMYVIPTPCLVAPLPSPSHSDPQLTNAAFDLEERIRQDRTDLETGTGRTGTVVRRIRGNRTLDCLGRDWVGDGVVWRGGGIFETCMSGVVMCWKHLFSVFVHSIVWPYAF